MPTPTKKWIDKKSATTFQVRYRSQKDPLIHDESASDFVFTQVEAPNAKPTTSSTTTADNSKIKTTHDLEEELGLDATAIRSNEGEAAMYGVYYDDTKYDYMQHLRDMGESTEAVFIEAPQAASKQSADRHGGKGKKKQSLADALEAQADVDEERAANKIIIPKELLPSEVELKRTYQDQQNVPDALKGFQPDMDPRLREVLEALEDDAYVDDDEDLFGQLAEDGEEVTAGEFADMFEDADYDDEDEGWQSDATEKPSKQQTTDAPSSEQTVPRFDNEEESNADWMKEFSKFKKDQKKAKPKAEDMSSLADTISFAGDSSIGGTMSLSGRTRRRLRKKGGAATASDYSMSSSALFRTEGQTLLDERFDRIEEIYNEDPEEDEPEGPPQVLPETRKDFNSIMDDFLENYHVGGKTKKRVKKGKYQSGMDQLDEIRRELGGVRLNK